VTLLGVDSLLNLEGLDDGDGVVGDRGDVLPGGRTDAWWTNPGTLLLKLGAYGFEGRTRRCANQLFGAPALVL
jgi:hypothetical protein